MKKEEEGTLVQGGQLYIRREPDGELVPTDDTTVTPDVWACRRVDDFPDRRVPTGGAVDVCRDCGAAIVYNPARTVAARKICLQCAWIEPLPFGA